MRRIVTHPPLGVVSSYNLHFDSRLLYHALIERQEWDVAPADSPGGQTLNTVRVLHYPHALTNKASAAESPP